MSAAPAEMAIRAASGAAPELSDVTAPVRPLLAWAVLAGAAAALCMIGQMGVLAALVTDLAFRRYDFGQEMSFVLGLMGLVGLRCLFQAVADSCGDKASIRAQANLRMEVARKLFDIGPVGLDGEPSGKIATALASGIEALGPYIGRYIPRLSGIVIVPLFILVVIFRLDWRSFLVLAVTGPLIPFFMALVGYAAQAILDRQWAKLLRLSGSFVDLLKGLTTLRIFGQAENGARMVASMAEAHRSETFKVMRVAFLTSAVLEFFSSLSIAMVAVLFGGRLLAGKIDFETAFFVLLLAPEYFAPLRVFSTSYHARQNAQSAFDPLAHVLSLPDLAEQARKQGAGCPAPRADIAAGDKLTARQIQALWMRDLAACYGDGPEVLKNLSASFPKDCLTLVMGPSGSGKTTLFRALLGMIPLASGELYVTLEDGTNAPRAALAVGWVPQHPYFFSGTIAQNLRLVAPKAPEEALEAACREAGAWSFIEKLPENLEFRLAEQGAPLSGGEVRRLALARALLSGAELLMLDEPTADLDQANAEEVVEALRRARQGRIVVVISHRSELGSVADQILVMKEGSLTEEESA